MATPPIVRVNEWQLRCRFNRGQFWERVKAGALKALTRARPVQPASGQPHDSTTQEVRYIDPETNQEVARTHQYVGADGTILASGLPDPKALMPPPEEGGHAAAHSELEHESGARCRAFERSATFTITCSSCSASIRFRLLVSASRIGSGVSKGLRCGGCGARWALGDERRGCIVYVAPPAA